MQPTYRLGVSMTSFWFLLLITGCAPMAADDNGTRDLAIVEQWSGDFPVANLALLPGGQRHLRAGYIDGQNDFAAVWRAFKPGEKIPVVDFKRNLIVFSRNVDFYNRINILKVTMVDGEAEIITMETLSAMPIEDTAAMVLAVVPRAGIKSIRAGDRQIPVKNEK